ncbi:MAG: hypothetical protein ACLRFN_03525 [Alphaproteobacteria bacterium]
MNEKRAKKAKYLTNTLVSDRDRQWRGLLGQLGVLEAKARLLDLETVVDLIDDLKNVIAKNQPNKKLFRAIQIKINQIDISMKRIEFLLRKKKQNTR